jgi:hypothetical protein
VRERTPLKLVCGISKGRCWKRLTTLGYEEGRIFATDGLMNAVVGEDGTSWWGGVCEKGHGSAYVREVDVVAAFEARRTWLEASQRGPIFRSA